MVFQYSKSKYFLLKITRFVRKFFQLLGSVYMSRSFDLGLGWKVNVLALVIKTEQLVLFSSYQLELVLAMNVTVVMLAYFSLFREIASCCLRSSQWC